MRHAPSNGNAYVHPVPGLAGAVLSWFANSGPLRRARRIVCALLPFPRLASDVEDIVYLTWIVPVERVRALVPPGVAVIDRAGLTLFTIVSYRHRHFGPTLLGPLRRLCASPLQSNWRLYVESLPGRAAGAAGATDAQARTVLFLRNVFESTAYALGSRVASDALPSHLAQRFTHRRTDGGYETVIDPGAGSAPALASTTERAHSGVLPVEYARFFATWEGAVRFLCRQEAAVVAVAGTDRLAQADIALPIDPGTAVPLRSTATGGAGFLERVGATGEPFCFAVPAARFGVLGERLLP